MLNPDKTAANVAIIENCYALVERGDMAGFLAQCSPDIVWEMIGERAQFPLFGTWQGREGVAAFFETLAATLEFAAFNPRDFHGAGDKVFVAGHYEMAMKGSGETAACDWTMVFTLRDGMVCGLREHTDTAAIVTAYRGAETHNAALVRQVYADFAASKVEAILAVCSPEIDWISGGSAQDFPTLGARQGIEGAASFFRDVAAHDEFTSFVPGEIRASGDKVIALGHYGITARATGKHFESDWAHVFEFANGKCTRFQEFTDTAAFYKAHRA